MNERKRASWIAYTVVALAALVAYPLSYGPFRWYLFKKGFDLGVPKPFWFEYLVEPSYAPLELILKNCPDQVQMRFDEYQLWWIGY